MKIGPLFEIINLTMYLDNCLKFDIISHVYEFRLCKQLNSKIFQTYMISAQVTIPHEIWYKIMF